MQFQHVTLQLHGTWDVKARKKKFNGKTHLFSGSTKLDRCDWPILNLTQLNWTARDSRQSICNILRRPATSCNRKFDDFVVPLPGLNNSNTWPMGKLWVKLLGLVLAFGRTVDYSLSFGCAAVQDHCWICHWVNCASTINGIIPSA